jgi:hypothetical protein
MTSDEALNAMLQSWKDLAEWLTDDEVNDGNPVWGDQFFLTAPSADDFWEAYACDESAVYQHRACKGKTAAEALTKLVAVVRKHHDELRSRLEVARAVGLLAKRRRENA